MMRVVFYRLILLVKRIQFVLINFIQYFLLKSLSLIIYLNAWSEFFSYFHLFLFIH